MRRCVAVIAVAVLVMSGCGGGSSESAPQQPHPPQTPPDTGPAPLPPDPQQKKSLGVRADVHGLDGGQVVLALVGRDSVAVNADDEVVLADDLAPGARYEVVIESQPPGTTCTLRNADGTMMTRHVSVHVECWADGAPWQLRTHAGVASVTLSWPGSDPATILYSSDRDCDWDNVAACADGTTLTSLHSGVTLDVTHGLKLGRDYFFAAEQGGNRSAVVGAVPWVPMVDGDVLAITEHDNRILIGGDFKAFVLDTGLMTIVDLAHGRPTGARDALHGLTVYEMVGDGVGGWFGISEGRILRIRADGTLDPAWNPPVDSVARIALDDGTLFFSGQFWEVDGEPRAGIGALDVSTGALLPWSPTHPYQFHRFTLLAAVAGVVFADEGRGITQVLDAGTAAVLHTYEFDAFFITTQTMSDDSLILGGNFDDGAARAGIVFIDLDDFSVEFAPWEFQGLRSVRALQAFDGELFVGGRFTLEEVDITNFVSFDLATLELTDWRPRLSGEVTQIESDGNTVFVTGQFQRVSMGRGVRFEARGDGAFAFDPVTKELRSWRIDRPHSASPARIAISGRAMLVSGLGAGIDADYLVAMDPATGRISGDSLPAVNAFVNSFLIKGDTIYMTGGFGDVSGRTRQGLAAFDARDGVVLPWRPRSGPGRLAAHGQAIFNAGSFPSFASANLAIEAFNNSDGAYHPWTHPRITGRARGIEVWEDTIILGGDLGVPDGRRLGVVGIAPATGALTGLGLGRGRVDAMARRGDILYLGAENLWAYDLASGGYLDWAPEVPGAIRLLLLGDDRIYTVASEGVGVGSVRAYSLATETASPLHIEYTGGTLGVLAIHEAGDRLYLGGSFRVIDGEVRTRFAVVDPSTSELVW